MFKECEHSQVFPPPFRSHNTIVIIARSAVAATEDRLRPLLHVLMLVISDHGKGIH